MRTLLIILYFVYNFSYANSTNKGGFPQAIKYEASNETTKVYGNIPNWLGGYLVRQACHAFGDHDSFSPASKITHLFDCMPGVFAVMFNNGSAHYSNRYLHKTHSNAVWNYFGRDFKNSKIGWRTLFTDMDSKRVQSWESRFTEVTGYYPGNPSINFWRIGQNVQAVSEGPYGLWLDVPTLAQFGPFRFQDDHFDLPGDVIIFQVSPLAARDSSDDSLWTTAIALAWKRRMLHRVIIRIKDDWREIVAAIPLDTNLKQEKCGPEGYTELESRPGYVYSVALTKTYMLIPVSSYLVDPCVKDDIPKPFYKTFAEFFPHVASKLMIFNKETGLFEQISFTPGFFAQNIVNAYEDEYANLLYVDILLFDNADWYERFFQIDNLINQGKAERGTLTRLTIDTRKWLLVARQSLGTELKPFLAFPTINHKYHGREYRYAYLVANPFFNVSCIEKLTISNGAVNFWCPGAQQYPHEPVFVPHPQATSEDDGVLLVPLYDSRTEKGQLAIIDASAMEIIAGLEMDHIIPFGLHGQFYKFEELGRSTAPSVNHVPFFVCYLVGIIVYNL